MRFLLGKLKWFAVTASATALLACGGGGGADSGNENGVGNPTPSTTRIRVVGDGFVDVGTFRTGRNTVHAEDSEKTLIWADHVAKAFNLTVCPRYIAKSGPIIGIRYIELNDHPDAINCTGYAVSGGSISFELSDTAQSFSAWSIAYQLKDSAKLSSYRPEDLLLVNAGHSDISTLMLYVSSDNSFGAYRQQLSPLLTPTQRNELAQIDNQNVEGLLKMGDIYANNLADVLADSLLTHVLDKSASRIVVMNVADVTRTPLSQDLYKQLTEKTGNTTLSNALDAAAKRWVIVFNTQLQKRLSNQSERVVIVDLYQRFNAWITQPSQYGFGNTKDRACQNLKDEFGNLLGCNESKLSATEPPIGSTGGSDWWKTYLFASDVYLTPKANQMIGDFVNEALINKGWLAKK